MIDNLSVFRGRDYTINSGLVIRHPTIGEIEEYGEKEYFGIVKTLTSTPADRKVDIWDSLHIYWDQMDEFELFISVFLSLRSKDMSILMPSVDFSSFRTAVNPNTKEIVLINQDKVKIDRAIFTILTNHLRAVHQMKKNRETGYDNFTAVNLRGVRQNNENQGKNL